MAENDPMKDKTPVRLDLPRSDRKFLEEVLRMARDGVRDELREHGARLREPRRLRREEAAYERLLAAIEEQRAFLPDPELCIVLTELAEVVDASNEFSRAAAEHKAIRGLLASLERRSACDSRRSRRAAVRCLHMGAI
jgi:hypothetical protein